MVIQPKKAIMTDSEQIMTDLSQNSLQSPHANYHQAATR